MNRLDVIEELQRDILNSINNHYMTEEEVISITEKSLQGLIDILQYNGVNIPTIEEYINGEIIASRARVKSVFEDRRGDIISQVNSIIRDIQYRMEEQSEGSNENQYLEQRELNRIESIDTNERRDSMKVIRTIEDSLLGIRAKVASILDVYGVSISKIDEVVYEIRRYIDGTLLEDESKLYELLSNERRQIVEELSQKYKDAMETIKQMEENKEDRDDFRDELDGGISLEEQAEQARRREESERIKQIISQLGINNDAPKPKKLGEDIELR